MKTLRATLLASLALCALAAGPAQAGTWSCGPNCDPATLKGITWTPSSKCKMGEKPEINAKTPKLYNEQAGKANEYINSGNTYFTCLNDEINGDFSSAQQNMNDTAKVYFQKIQDDFKKEVDGISAQLDDVLKKLNKK